MNFGGGLHATMMLMKLKIYPCYSGRDFLCQCGGFHILEDPRSYGVLKSRPFLLLRESALDSRCLCWVISSGFDLRIAVELALAPRYT